MTKISLGQAIQIFANAGVIAGIALLAFELHQNNDLLQLQVESERRSRVNSLLELVINNPEYSDLMAKEESELSEVERDRLVALGFRLLLNVEDLYRDVILGRSDPDEAVRTVRAIWHRNKLNYGAPLAWDTYRSRGDPEFIEWMERNILDERSTEP